MRTIIDTLLTIGNFLYFIKPSYAWAPKILTIDNSVKTVLAGKTSCIINTCQTSIITD